MLDQAINDEPSMEGILAEVRRLILQDEAARCTPAVPQERGDPILLTQMLTADGSVVNIARGTKAHVALCPMRAGDGFAKIESLQEAVAAMLGSDAGGGRAAQNRAPRQDGPAAFRDLPDSTVRLAGLSLAPIVADNPGRVPACASLPETLPVPACASGEIVEPAGATPCRPAADANEARDPSTQIERMLVHQMAAAHEAAMMLANAAVGQIRGGSADGDEPLPRPRRRAHATNRKRQGDDAARLADTAARMMQAYNTALGTLIAFGGDAAASIAARGKGPGRSMTPAGAKAPHQAGARPHRAGKQKRKHNAGRPRCRTATGSN